MQRSYLVEPLHWYLQNILQAKADKIVTRSLLPHVRLAIIFHWKCKQSILIAALKHTAQNFYYWANASISCMLVSVLANLRKGTLSMLLKVDERLSRSKSIPLPIWIFFETTACSHPTFFCATPFESQK